MDTEGVLIMVEKISLMIEDYSVLVKSNDIWNKTQKKSKTKFHNMSVYDEKYIKANVQ